MHDILFYLVIIGFPSGLKWGFMKGNKDDRYASGCLPCVCSIDALVSVPPVIWLAAMS